jgi:AraC-like DNA-binding protein
MDMIETEDKEIRFVLLSADTENDKRIMNCIASINPRLACTAAPDSFTNSHGHRHLVLATDCNYHCSLPVCAQKFLAAVKWRSAPLLIFRPLLSKSPDVHGKAYLASLLANGAEAETRAALRNELALELQDFQPLPFFNPDQRILRVQREIVEKQGLHIGRSELAVMSGRSTTWLSSRFRKYSGVTLSSFIEKNLFCHVLWEMISTEIPVKQIAREHGYADPLYFGKSFKRHFGMSPTHLRRHLFSTSEYRQMPYTGTPFTCN